MIREVIFILNSMLFSIFLQLARYFLLYLTYINRRGTLRDAMYFLALQLSNVCYELLKIHNWMPYG